MKHSPGTALSPAQSSPSQLAKAATHKESTQETLPQKGTTSRPGEVAVSPNSYKQTNKKQKSNKIRKQRNMFQMKEQNKTPEKYA